MGVSKKIWIGITAALFAAGGDSEQEPQRTDGATPVDKPAASSVVEGGEGEGEGTAEPADLAQSDVAFLERLGLIRGHLHVGNALYQEGQVEMAETHMKHPRDELYAGLVPAIRARGASPFDTALTALAEAVESDAGNERVETAWQAVDDAIRTIASSTNASVRQQLVAIANMVRTAADEYAIGVVDGEIDNAHEYQDAWGFVQVARARLDALSPDGEAERKITAEATEALEGIDSLWPGLAPEGPVEGQASTLYGAAARIELAALSLDEA